MVEKDVEGWPLITARVAAVEKEIVRWLDGQDRFARHVPVGGSTRRNYGSITRRRCSCQTSGRVSIQERISQNRARQRQAGGRIERRETTMHKVNRIMSVSQADGKADPVGKVISCLTKNGIVFDIDKTVGRRCGNRMWWRCFASCRAPRLSGDRRVGWRSDTQ